MLKEILETCNYASNNSKFVKINYSKLEEVSKTVNTNNYKHWLENNPFGILNFGVETIVNFLLIYHSIGSFSYWGDPKWSIKTAKGEIDGSYAMLYLLVEEIKINPNFLNFDYLSKMTKTEFQTLLQGNVEIPLLEERYNNLKTISQTVIKEMNGNFYNYIKDIYLDKDLFTILTNYFSEVFYDVSNYQGKTIYFYKLAQLLTSDILHIRKIKEQINTDYSNLVGCADYKIPQVLRSLGILEYNEELANLVDNKKEISKDHDMEIEIRANMIVAINKISDITGNSPMDINDAIWLKGQNKDLSFKPYHLTRTRFY